MACAPSLSCSHICFFLLWVPPAGPHWVIDWLTYFGLYCMNRPDSTSVLWLFWCRILYVACHQSIFVLRSCCICFSDVNLFPIPASSAPLMHSSSSGKFWTVIALTLSLYSYISRSAFYSLLTNYSQTIHVCQPPQIFGLRTDTSVSTAIVRQLPYYLLWESDGAAHYKKKKSGEWRFSCSKDARVSWIMHLILNLYCLQTPWTKCCFLEIYNFINVLEHHLVFQHIRVGYVHLNNCWGGHACAWSRPAERSPF